MRTPLAALCALAVLTVACSGPAAPKPVEPRETSAEPALPPGRGGEAHSPGGPEGGTSSAQARDDLPLVIFLGDSITAGYGISGEDAFPALVEASMAGRGRPVRVVNAGVSGDTTSGGLGRLDWLLRLGPDLVVVELGANDGLRGLPLDLIEENLRTIVERCRGAGASVLLAGMRVPPNYGPEYSEAFHALYARLAEETGADLIPFVLEGVAGSPSLNLPDGIHPTPEGHALVAATVAGYVEAALRASATGEGGPSR